MEEIIQNYNTVLEQIRISADEADRNMDEIKLIIVTKKFDVETMCQSNLKEYKRLIKN